MLFQEAEISDKVEFNRVAHLHLGQVRDLGEVAFAVAPVQSYGDEFIPCSGRIAAPLVLGEIVERKCADSLSADDDGGGLRVCGSFRGLRSSVPQARDLFVTEPPDPQEFRVQLVTNACPVRRQTPTEER